MTDDRPRYLPSTDHLAVAFAGPRRLHMAGYQRLTEMIQWGETEAAVCDEGQTIRHGAYRHGV